MERTPADRHCGRGAAGSGIKPAAAATPLLWALLVLATCHAGRAEQAQAPAASPVVCQAFRVRPQDQIWLVSTRHLSCPSGKNQPALHVCRYEQGWWQPATLAEFYAADSAELVTPLYIHGNRIDAAEAGSFGLSVYFELVGKFDAEPPARFVIWSWPSDQIHGPLKDVQAKAERSDVEAFYLAHFLAGMQPDVRVGLVGYSFGARIASGALQLLSGGSLCGWTAPASTPPQMRVVMWAAAEHSHWYLPGQFHDRALAAAEAWFVTINCCDPVLARYRFIDRCSNPSAVGYTGIYGRNLLPADVNARIEEVNVTNIVGGEHDWRRYLYSLYIQNGTRDYVLWHELGVASPAQPATQTAARSTAPLTAK